MARTNGEMEPVAQVEKVVRFWSTHRSYKIAVSPGRNLAFKDHALVLPAGSKDADAVRAVKSPYVREVLEQPFAKDEDQAEFSKYLRKLVFRGEHDIATRSGLLAIEGMFRREDIAAMRKNGQAVPDLLIMKAIKTKSFKEGV